MLLLFFFFFNDTATTEIYTLSLHDALPISVEGATQLRGLQFWYSQQTLSDPAKIIKYPATIQVSKQKRSEEHTSELQSQSNLVCRLLLEKKNSTKPYRRQANSSHTHIHMLL